MRLKGGSKASKLPRGVREAFRDVVYDFGIEQLSAMMDMSLGTLYNKCNVNENESNHNKPTVADLIIVTNLTRDHRAVHALCAAVGMGAYLFPDYSNLSTDALMMHLLKIEKEGGDFYREIRDALANDNVIDAGEYARIEKEGLEFVSAILESLERMREMSK